MDERATPEDQAIDWRAALAAGEPFEREARLRRVDGEYRRRFLLRFVPLRDAQGKVIEWYATSTDIEDLSAPRKNCGGERPACATSRSSSRTPIA